jgi:hypothetical protein
VPAKSLYHNLFFSSITIPIAIQVQNKHIRDAVKKKHSALKEKPKSDILTTV